MGERDEMFAFGRRVGEVIQFAYTVPDIHTAMAEHVRILGIGPWFYRGPFTPPNARYKGTHTGLTITLARAFSGSMMVELIQQHDDGPSVYREVIDKRGYGFHHYAIAARQAEVEVERLERSGYQAKFDDRLPSGARVVYLDAAHSLAGMIEVLEVNESVERMYQSFYTAALDWDGSNPFRAG